MATKATATAIITMSMREVDRLKVVQAVIDQVLRNTQNHYSEPPSQLIDVSLQFDKHLGITASAEILRAGGAHIKHGAC
jgi:hypothetical protein